MPCLIRESVAIFTTHYIQHRASFIKLLETRKLKYFIFHFIFYMAALFTKETAIALPILCFFFIIFMSNRKKMASIKFIILWSVITAIWLVIRHNALGGSNGYTAVEALTALINNLPALPAYISKLLLPFNLSVFPIIKDMAANIFTGVIFIVFMLVVLFKNKLEKTKHFIFLLLWFSLFLLPSFIQIPQTGGTANFSEHRVYLSSIGIFIFIMEINWVKNLKISLKRVRVVGISIVIILSAITVRYSFNFKDRISFWENAVKTSPHYAFNSNNLGAIYYLNGDLNKAEKYFRGAVKINTYEPKANANIGLICMNTGRLEEAEEYFLKELNFNPNYTNAYFNLGLLYYRLQKFDKTIICWKKVIEINPYYNSVHQNLYIVLKQTNKAEEMKKLLNEAKKHNIKINL